MTEDAVEYLINPVNLLKELRAEFLSLEAASKEKAKRSSGSVAFALNEGMAMAYKDAASKVLAVIKQLEEAES